MRLTFHPPRAQSRPKSCEPKREREVFFATVTYGYLPDYCAAVKAYRGQVIEKSSILK
jgi:hypothetical protein